MTLAVWFARDVFGDGHEDDVWPEGLKEHDKEHDAAARSSTPSHLSGASAEYTLVQQVRQGDEGAFAEIATQHWEALWRYAYRSLHDADRASDVVQDALFSLWCHRDRLDPARGVRAYLFGVIRFRTLKLRRHDAVIRRAEAENIAAAVSGTGHHLQVMAEPLNEQELAMALEHVVAALPEARREVLILRWWHGLTYEEIAEVLNLGVSAVKMQVRRAVAQLRPLLEREFRDR